MKELTNVIVSSRNVKPGAFRRALTFLKKKGLITNELYGAWKLTDKGVEVLKKWMPKIMTTDGSATAPTEA